MCRSWGLALMLGVCQYGSRSISLLCSLLSLVRIKQCERENGVYRMFLLGHSFVFLYTKIPEKLKTFPEKPKFSRAGPTIYTVLQSQTLSSFRRHSKTHYFQSAYPAP